MFLHLGRKRQHEWDCDSPVPSLDLSRTSFDDEEISEDNPPPSKKVKGTSNWRCLRFLIFVLI